jgi:hypothetical protein
LLCRELALRPRRRGAVYPRGRVDDATLGMNGRVPLRDGHLFILLLPVSVGRELLHGGRATTAHVGREVLSLLLLLWHRALARPVKLLELSWVRPRPEGLSLLESRAWPRPERPALLELRRLLTGQWKHRDVGGRNPLLLILQVRRGSSAVLRRCLLRVWLLGVRLDDGGTLSSLNTLVLERQRILRMLVRRTLVLEAWRRRGAVLLRHLLLHMRRYRSLHVGLLLRVERTLGALGTHHLLRTAARWSRRREASAHLLRQRALLAMRLRLL